MTWLLELDEVQLTSDPFELNLEQLVSLAAEPLSFDFSTSLFASQEGVVVRDAVVQSGDFRVRD